MPSIVSRDFGCLLQGRGIYDVKGSVCFVLKFALPSLFSPSRLWSAIYRAEGISWVKGSVCFVLKLALPPFSPPLLSGVQYRAEGIYRVKGFVSFALKVAAPKVNSDKAGAMISVLKVIKFQFYFTSDTFHISDWL